MHSKNPWIHLLLIVSLAVTCILPRVSYAADITSQNVVSDSVNAEAPDTTRSNITPYASKKSVGEHLLAFPSYLLHWSTRPIGWGVKWAERTLPGLLQGERAPYGVYPFFELGGDVGVAYGLLLYHNQLFKYNHQARIEALFGSQDFNDFDFEYTIPDFLSRDGQLDLDLSYSNDPRKSLYGGNNSELTGEMLYAKEEMDTELKYLHFLSSSTQLGLSGRYRRVDIQQNDYIGEQSLPIVHQSLRGTSALLSLGTSVQLDLARGTPRILRGSRYKFGLSWNRSLTNDEFHFLKYNFEWNQFIPLPFLPDTRRLGFKTRLQKTAALGDKQVPFYDYPSLGSSYDLRGFPSSRFRDDGALLMTLEYRFPLWSFADIVLFVDEGQVFNEYSDIHLKDFHTSYGFGFHLISTKGFAFRSEFAFSHESSRVILSINPNF